MRTGLVSITFRQLAVAEIIKVAKENGLEGIEWGGDVHVPHGDLSVARKVAKMTADAGLEVASYGSYFRFEEDGPSMESVIETAEALGAPAIRIWAGKQGPGVISGEDRDRIVKTSRRLSEECARRGMRLDFEFHENTLTETPESTCQLLADIDHPAAHSLWQPPLMTSIQERLAGLRQVKHLVSNIHCNYFAQDPWPNIHPLEEGSGEWRDYLEEFRELSTDRWILLEHVKDHSVEQFKRDALTLHGWLNQRRAVSRA